MTKLTEKQECLLKKLHRNMSEGHPLTDLTTLPESYRKTPTLISLAQRGYIQVHVSITQKGFDHNNGDLS